MASETKIDYTNKRLSRRIRVCPKCGRKGEVMALIPPCAMYVHRAELVNSYLSYRRITDSCTVKVAA